MQCVYFALSLHPTATPRVHYSSCVETTLYLVVVAALLVGVVVPFSQDMLSSHANKVHRDEARRRYLEPLLIESYNLQSLLYDIGTGRRGLGLCSASANQDAEFLCQVNNAQALYAFARFFARDEALRRARHLVDFAPESDLGWLARYITDQASVASRKVYSSFRKIKKVMGYSWAHRNDSLLFIARGTKRLIGESLLRRCSGSVLSFREFQEKFQSGGYGDVFEELQDDLQYVTAHPGCSARLPALQHALVEFIRRGAKNDHAELLVRAGVDVGRIPRLPLESGTCEM